MDSAPPYSLSQRLLNAVVARVVRALRRLGQHAIAERLERELEAFLQELRTDRTSPGPPSAAAVGRELIDQLGMPENVNRSGLADARAKPSTGEAASQGPIATKPPVSADAWLIGLKEKESRERDRSEQRLVRHVQREALLFRLLLFFAIVAAAFASLGVVLMLAGFVPVGVVSAAIGLLPGAGTFLIRDMWRHERERRDAAEAARSEYAAVLEATEFALALEDERERSNQARAIAERLQERAFPTT
jgi:hypothetical protein